MKTVLWIILGIVVLVAAAYLGVGYMVYDKLSLISVGESETLTNTPDQFIVEYDGFQNFDTKPYLIPEYVKVSFSSRQPGITLVGWYAEANPSAPVVVVTHGIGAGKFAANALISAGMLYKNGINVLVYDLRNHGESSVDNGRTSVGNKEYLDVLGAWDYLVNTRGYDPARVGVYGLSLGGASTLNAFAMEPRITAVAVDSPFANLQQIIAEEMVRTGYPALLAPAGIISARLFAGVDLLAQSPADAVRNDKGRPMLIIHGTADERVNVRHAQQLEALAKQTGANLTVWYVDGAKHVQSELDYPQQYEQQLTAFFKATLMD